MNVGLPGTGIGGLFYILYIVLMFGIEVVRYIFKKNTNRKFAVMAVQQMLILVGIIFSMIALDLFLAKLVVTVKEYQGSEMTVQQTHFLAVAPIVATAGLLFLVLALVRVFAFFKHSPNNSSPR